MRAQIQIGCLIVSVGTECKTWPRLDDGLEVPSLEPEMFTTDLVPSVTCTGKTFVLALRPTINVWFYLECSINAR